MGGVDNVQMVYLMCSVKVTVSDTLFVLLKPSEVCLLIDYQEAG